VRKNGFLATALSIGLIMGVSGASAAIVYDTITVYDDNDVAIAGVTATEAELIADPFEVFYVGGIAVDSSLFGDYSEVVSGATPVDIFGIATGGPDPEDLAFAPGAEAETYALQNPYADTGLPISMTEYLDPSLQLAGDTAYFTASGDLTIGVPEPSTWLLMMAGIGGVGLGLRRGVGGFGHGRRGRSPLGVR
jgi:hypothetical protein